MKAKHTTGVKRNRSVLRALEVLLALNELGPATPQAIGRTTGLPRPSVYRILETLREAGYVQRDDSDANYRLTHRVRRLSAGYEEEHWIAHLAMPIMREAGRELVWPIALSTISGTSMIVRDATDYESPLAAEKVMGGHRVPVLGSAAGKVYLAFCGESERREILDLLAASKEPVDLPARNRTAMDQMLADIRMLGFAVNYRQRRLSALAALAVPIIVADHCIATLSVRYAASAVTERRAVEEFLPVIRRATRSIAERYSESPPEP